MRRRDFNKILCSGALLAAAPLRRACAEDGGAAGMPVGMTVYDHGKTTELSPTTREARHIANECTRLLQNATGVLRLVVTPHLIEGLKHGEYCLELTYDAQVDMQMAKLADHSVSFFRMLVPLSGSFAENVSTVFTGSPDVYDGVPYRNNANISAMRNYVEAVVRQGKKRIYYPPF